MKYRVVVEPGAERDLRKLAADVRARILRAAMALADDRRPCGYRKLAGRGDQYRIRVGDYRIIYDRPSPPTPLPTRASRERGGSKGLQLWSVD